MQSNHRLRRGEALVSMARARRKSSVLVAKTEAGQPGVPRSVEVAAGQQQHRHPSSGPRHGPVDQEDDQEKAEERGRAEEHPCHSGARIGNSSRIVRIIPRRGETLELYRPAAMADLREDWQLCPCLYQPERRARVAAQPSLGARARTSQCTAAASVGIGPFTGAAAALTSCAAPRRYTPIRVGFKHNKGG